MSGVVVVGSIAFLLHQGLAGPKTGPDIRVLTDSVRQGSAGYVVHLRAENLGGATAASLAIEGELSDAGGVVETAETVIDYVPAGAARAAGLIFRRDPGAYRLEIRPKGFDTP